MACSPAWYEWPGAKSAAARLGQRLSLLRGERVDVPKSYVQDALDGKKKATRLRGYKTELGWLVDPTSIEEEAQRRKDERPHPRSKAVRDGQRRSADAGRWTRLILAGIGTDAGSS